MYQSHSQECHVSGVVGWHKTNIIVFGVNFVFCFGIFCPIYPLIACFAFDLFVFMWFIYIDCFEKKRQKRKLKVGWVGYTGRTGGGEERWLKYGA